MEVLSLIQAIIFWYKQEFILFYIMNSRGISRVAVDNKIYIHLQ